jgi:putative DNA primase/helicase
MSESDFLNRLEEEFRQEVERRRLEQEKEEAEDQIDDDPLSFHPSGEITQDSLDYLYGDKPWICVNDKLYYWTGTHYRHSLDVVELKRIADFLNEYSVVDKNGQSRHPHAKPSKVRQCLEWLKLRLGLDPSLVNPPGLNCTNGVLQIHWTEDGKPSWQLIPHDKSQYYLYV